MSHFENLLNTAKNEPQPQRILFLFAKAIDQAGVMRADCQGGRIEAVMCVDKSPEDLSTFKSLVAEADQQSVNWNLILTSTLSGNGGQNPSDSEILTALQKMSNIFAKQEDLSQFIVWNRQEEIIEVT